MNQNILPAEEVNVESNRRNSSAEVLVNNDIPSNFDITSADATNTTTEVTCGGGSNTEAPHVNVNDSDSLRRSGRNRKIPEKMKDYVMNF